jgi:hypothetical protein
MKRLLWKHVSGEDSCILTNSHRLTKRNVTSVGLHIEKIKNLSKMGYSPKIRFRFADPSDFGPAFDLDPSHSLTSAEAEPGSETSTHGWPSQLFVEFSEMDTNIHKRVVIDVLDVRLRTSKILSTTNFLTSGRQCGCLHCNTHIPIYSRISWYLHINSAYLAFANILDISEGLYRLELFKPLQTIADKPVKNGYLVLKLYNPAKGRPPNFKVWKF